MLAATSDGKATSQVGKVRSGKSHVGLLLPNRSPQIYVSSLALRSLLGMCPTVTNFQDMVDTIATIIQPIPSQFLSESVLFSPHPSNCIGIPHLQPDFFCIGIPHQISSAGFLAAPLVCWPAENLLHGLCPHCTGVYQDNGLIGLCRKY